VAEAVDLALQCDLQDECLAKLRVLEVRPTGRASRLEVVVAAQVEDLAELGELRSSPEPPARLSSPRGESGDPSQAHTQPASCLGPRSRL